jgi:hypothetical protein
VGEIAQLFPEGVPFQPWQRHEPKAVHHSQTSMDAAQAIKPKAGTLRAQVLELIQRHPEGLTDEEISTLLSMNPSTARPRRLELAVAGLIESHGTALTASGRSANLWRAVPTTESA